MSYGRFLACAAMLAAVTFSGSALADRTADQANSEGRALLAKGQFEAARAAFAEAYSRDPQPKFLWNLAFAENRTNRYVDALKHFKAYFATSSSYSQQDKDIGTQYIAALEKKTGHIRIQAPVGTVVTLDGIDVGTAPMADPLDVEAGLHTVAGRVTAAEGGNTSKTVQVSAPAGEVVTATLALPEPQKEKRAQGEQASPPVPVTPPPAEPAPEVKSNDSPLWPALPIALGAVSLVGIGVGSYFAIQSGSKKDDVNDYIGQHPAGFCADRSTNTCQSYLDLRSDHDRAVTYSWISFGVGAAAGVGALVTFFALPHGKTKAQAQVSPLVGPGLSGLQLRTSF